MFHRNGVFLRSGSNFARSDAMLALCLIECEVVSVRVESIFLFLMLFRKIYFEGKMFRQGCEYCFVANGWLAVELNFERKFILRRFLRYSILPKFRTVEEKIEG